jgi:Ribbon-helix-helix protein, copG family
MLSPMGSVTLRMSAELIEALDAAAAERHATRSALIRGVLEDALDAGELPTVRPTSQELLDVEFERLRELSRR